MSSGNLRSPLTNTSKASSLLRPLREAMPIPIQNINVALRDLNTPISSVLAMVRQLRIMRPKPAQAKSFLSAKDFSVQLRAVTMSAAEKFRRARYSLRTNPVITPQDPSFYVQKSHLSATFSRRTSSAKEDLSLRSPPEFSFSLVSEPAGKSGRTVLSDKPGGAGRLLLNRRFRVRKGKYATKGGTMSPAIHVARLIGRATF